MVSPKSDQPFNDLAPRWRFAVLKFFAGICVAWNFCHANWQVEAHDLWILPPESIGVGDKIRLQASTGMDFPCSSVAIDPAKFALRRILHPDGKEGTLSPEGIEEKVGLMSFSPSSNGIYVVAVQTEAKQITLAAPDFNSYLVSDGLPHIYLLRSEEGTLNQIGRERYSKFPKAIIQVGEGGGGDPCCVLGLELEIVPRENPLAKQVGETLLVQVLFQGRPLAEANLGWDRAGDGEAASGTVRTDQAGEAMVPIQQTGLMTIRLTHMTRPQTSDYEWESFWTTLTFRIHGKPTKP